MLLQTLLVQARLLIAVSQTSLRSSPEGMAYHMGILLLVSANDITPQIFVENKLSCLGENFKGHLKRKVENIHNEKC